MVGGCRWPPPPGPTHSGAARCRPAPAPRPPTPPRTVLLNTFWADSTHASAALMRGRVGTYRRPSSSSASDACRAATCRARSSLASTLASSFSTLSAGCPQSRVWVHANAQHGHQRRARHCNEHCNQCRVATNSNMGAQIPRQCAPYRPPLPLPFSPLFSIGRPPSPTTTAAPTLRLGGVGGGVCAGHTHR